MKKIQLKEMLTVFYSNTECVVAQEETACPRLATRGFVLWREAVLLNLVSYIKTERQELVALMGGEEKRQSGRFSRLTLKIGQMENTSNGKSIHRYI